MDNQSYFLDIQSAVRTQDRWPKLLEEIDRGNIIPVIGPDLLVEPKVSDDGSGKIENLHQQIISYIAKCANVTSHPRTFSQLVYDPDFQHTVKNKTDVIYRLIEQVTDNLSSIKEINHEPSQLLMDLLGTYKFPFVITTSFTPIVEQTIKKLWGEVKVYNFTNDPNSSLAKQGGDILSEEDLKRPSVLYMLGKYCNNPEKYAVTDSDMMTYCASWMKGYGVPKILTDTLKKKYLLILGNNYSDWLYRFVWFSLRMAPNEMKNVMKSDVVVNEDAEESFIQFLERLQTFYQEDPSKVIQRIKKEMETRQNDQPFTIAIEHFDAFISYSHADKDVATNLYKALTNKGLKVWLDTVSIGANNWKEAIKHGIKNSRVFIPIVSENVKKESFEPHEYRTEWATAAEMAKNMGGRTFIIPFAEKGFDFYNPLTKLPEEFTEKNASWYASPNDVENFAQLIYTEVQKIKEIKQTL